MYTNDTIIYCRKCGKELTVEAKFCNNCGATVVKRKLTHDQLQNLLEALRNIYNAISSALNLRIVLDRFLELVTNQLRVDAADVLLINSRTQTLEYIAGRGFHTPISQKILLRVEDELAGQAIMERRMVSTHNFLETPGLIRQFLVTEEKFQSYYGIPLIVKGQVKGVLEIFHRQPLHPNDEWVYFLEALAGQAAIAVDNATLFDILQRTNVDLIRAYDTTLEGWSRALDLRDKETEGHTQRVTEMTLELARAMAIKEEDLVRIRRGALLHDIGKMGIPDSILLKPGALTPEETMIMRQHPIYAYKLLSPIEYLRDSLDIPFHHHEKWDGSGYPLGLQGESIPLAARMFAVVDVWDALVSDRPYRKGWSKEKVREHIQSSSGTHFDPKVVEVFLRLDSVSK